MEKDASFPTGCATTVAGVSGRFAVRDALAILTREVASWGVSETDMASFELVIAEALNNVVEHACAGAEGIPFKVHVAKCRDGLAVEIRDNGIAMPDGALPSQRDPLDSNAKGSCIQELPEGGWGWNLIHVLTEQISYQRLDDANHLSITLRLNPSEN